jgi:hypothetical protein
LGGSAIRAARVVLPVETGLALAVAAESRHQVGHPPVECPERLREEEVLWINMVTSSTLGLALAFELAERGLMARRPRPPGEALLSGFFIWRVLMVSVLMMTGALGLFLWETHHGTSVETARTMAVDAVVAAEMFYIDRSVGTGVAQGGWCGAVGLLRGRAGKSRDPAHARHSAADCRMNARTRAAGARPTTISNMAD